jgi:hypothetical protein
LTFKLTVRSTLLNVGRDRFLFRVGCRHVGQQSPNITSLAKTGKAELATGGIHNKKPHETLGAWSEELLRSTVSENKRNALENYMCEAFSRNNYNKRR